MTAPNNKPLSEADKALFAQYYRENPAWGHLHIVLDDENIHENHVLYCRNEAERLGDTQAVYLADVLLGMSKSQRLKLSRTSWNAWRT